MQAYPDGHKTRLCRWLIVCAFASFHPLGEMPAETDSQLLGHLFLTTSKEMAKHVLLLASSKEMAKHVLLLASPKEMAKHVLLLTSPKEMAKHVLLLTTSKANG